MTNNEFVIWMKGFVTACNEFTPTPKQWDLIREELGKVNENKGISIGVGGYGATTVTQMNPDTPFTYTTKNQ